MKKKNLCPRKRKGQMQMTETIAVLFIFFILILFGIMFYYKYQGVAFKEKQEELLGARAMDTTLKVLFLPEISCTKGEAEPEDNCFDMMKLRHANETFKKYITKYYFNLFSYSRIYVQEVYPEQTQYILYDKEIPFLEDGTKGWEKKEPTFFTVTLKDESKSAIIPHYGFGYVVVEVYL
ncbi:hypothetical protein COY27_03655 [Candidatus Woesearchaeota archaeon CG_4_10_14_0_2_um_filter_33_13]|nr:MAG: hypothetical protein COY27_03655 [Candidatus Woesearchaeota archaeon CG_4_10_14_0_2_um_filter_33_13]